jgi:hypothetical protein
VAAAISVLAGKLRVLPDTHSVVARNESGHLSDLSETQGPRVPFLVQSGYLLGRSPRGSACCIHAKRESLWSITDLPQERPDRFCKFPRMVQIGPVGARCPLHLDAEARSDALGGLAKGGQAFVAHEQLNGSRDSA